MTENQENITILFGPDGKYELHIPVKDIDETKKTGRSFVAAGLALLTLNNQTKKIQNNNDAQKLFDWMKNLDEKAA